MGQRDAANQRVVQIDDMTGAGWQTWSVPVNPNYSISYPAGVAVDGLDRIYVVDFEGSVLHRIDGIDGSGHLQYFAPQQPKYVAVTQKGHIYLSLFNGADAVVSIDDISGSNYTELDGPPGHHFINPGGIVVK